MSRYGERPECRPDSGPGPVGTRLWVISAETTDCDHPNRDLDEMGDDGLNGYYECTRCGATLVFQEAVAFMGRDSAWRVGSRSRE